MTRYKDRDVDLDAGADDGIGKAFIAGSVIGFVLSFTLFGGVALLAGLGVGAAIGIGMFTALWGGPGFGGMMGAVLHFTKTADH